ncbi:MAG: FCD domain-containing protein [Arthrobacter sp.]|uniref:FadR/GntR family transcriptional regulator n=1 Tax=Arthrobacter sp. TaxID=1667 RepID=UPI00346D9E7A
MTADTATDASPGDASPIEGAALAGIDRRTAIDAVRLRIGMAISLGLLGPGERLPAQSELALGLSVSPITARRALTSLAEQGVVVRRRGRGGGTFVADHPPAAVLRDLVAGPGESVEVHRLVDQRLLLECAVTHFAALNATPEQLDELDRLTARMAAAASWSAYHQADEEFHRLVGRSSALGGAVDAYVRVLAELYGFFLPYPIERLHEANRDHIRLVAALRHGDVEAAVEVSRGHVDALHRTMFMGLLERRNGAG